MPIHDQSYRHYAGIREPPGLAWTVIARTGLASLARKRLFWVVMAGGWLQFLVLAVMFYLSATFPQMDEVIGPSPETFRAFFDRQGLFVFVFTVYVGAGLIATDRRAHALQIYLSKPLTRAEYIAGKLAILLVLLLLVTWVPAMLLLVLQVMFAGDLVFLSEHLFLVPAMTVFGFVYALMASFAMLALSSLSTSARFVGVLYAGLLLFTDAIADFLRAVTGSSVMAWVSFSANLGQLGDVIFRLAPRYDTPWPVSLAGVIGVMAVSIAVLERRIRGVEIVT